LNGTIDETKHPVIFISHGTGGSLASHYDTALALAKAGFEGKTLLLTPDV
jgi:predicted dienelactone hydrolase